MKKWNNITRIKKKKGEHIRVFIIQLVLDADGRRRRRRVYEVLNTVGRVGLIFQV